MPMRSIRLLVVRRGARSVSRSCLAPAPFPVAGLLEEVPHDRSMHGLDSRPRCAAGVVLMSDEGGEEEPPLLLALDEQFGRQPVARAGTKQCEVGGAAPHLPAE